MGTEYTILVRKSKLEYLAVCLELNVIACGDDLADVEQNVKAAIQLKLADLQEHPETVVAPISIKELVEFLQDTQPDWYETKGEGLMLRPLEVHEVPSYA